MALIAGYVSRTPLDRTVLLERVKAFTSGQHCLTTTKHGHLIIAHAPGYPIPPRVVSNAQGHALATLGFLTVADEPVEPEDLLACCVKDATAPEFCQGEYVTLFADAQTGAVHIVNDRFGSRPLYLRRVGEATYFSSHLAFLLHLTGGASPDLLGWLQVFSWAHTLGSRTTLEGVQRMRPGTHLMVFPDTVSERQYWRLAHHPDPGLDPLEHSAKVFAAFQAGTAFRANLVRKGVVALSGGLDSRLLAGALPDDVDFSAFTFVDAEGVTSTPQTRAAAAVCGALGLRHEIRALPGYAGRARETLALAGPLRPLHHMAIATAYVDEVKRQGAAFLLGGGPGDSLAGAFIPSALYLTTERLSEGLEDAYQRRLARTATLALVFRDDVLAAYRDQLADSLRQSFAALTGPTAAHRVTAWAMVERQPAFTFTSLIHTHPEVTEAFCHLDYRYTDLMLQLPAAWLYRKNFYAYMIYHQLPDLRHVPYANTGKRLTGRLATFVPESRIWTLASGLGQRISRKVARTVRPPARDHAAALGELRPAIRARLSTHANVLDLPKCERFLQHGDHDDVLGSLASLCL